MSGFMGRILFNDVAGNWQDVVCGLTQLSIPFRRLHAFATVVVYDASFPKKNNQGSVF